MSAQKFIVVLFGTILLVVIVYSGVETVRSYSASANRDQLVSSLYDLGTMAQKHFHESAAKGGGENSFKEWRMPADYGKTEYGTFEAVTHEKRVDLCGIGSHTGKNGFTAVRVAARIDSSGVKVTIIN